MDLQEVQEDTTLVGSSISGSNGIYNLGRVLSASQTVAVLSAQPDGDAPQEVIVKLAISPAGIAAVDTERQLLSELEATPHLAAFCKLPRKCDNGHTEGKPWIALQFIPGDTAAKLVSELKVSGTLLDGDRVARYVGQLAVTLASVHSLGWVHCDISAHNVILNDGGAYLVDFGAATRLQGKRQGLTELSPGEGTPGYVAPERLQRRHWDTRTDVYSLGCLWYELATGRPVFEGADVDSITRQHAYSPPPRFADDCSVPPSLRSLLRTMLAKDPFARPSRMSQVARAIAKALSTPLAKGFDADSRLTFESRLYGRSRCAAVATQLVRATVEGKGREVLLVGERGVGKTRLLRELVFLAQRQGLVLKELTEETALRDLPQYMQAPTELGTVLIWDNVPSTSLWNQVRARKRNLVHNSSIALVGSLRADGDTTAVVDMGLEHSLVLPVEPIGREATRRMLTDLLGGAVAEHVFRHVWRHSRGFPDKVVDWTRQKLDEGALRADPEGIWSTDPERNSVLPELPHRFSPTQERLIGYMTVLGNVFQKSELVGLAELDGMPIRETVGEHLLNLYKAGLIVPNLASDQWSLDERYRDHVEARLSLRKAQALHALRCSQLKALPGADPRRFAFHRARSGDWLGAIRYAESNRVMKSSSSSPTLQLDLLEYAFELANAHRENTTARRRSVRVGFRLLLALSKTGDHNGVRQLAETLLRLAADSFPLLEARILRCAALSYRIVGDHADALELLAAAWTRLTRATTPDSAFVRREKIRNQLDVSWVYYSDHDGHMSLTAVQRVLPLAKRDPNDCLLAEVLLHTGKALALKRRYWNCERAIALDRRAVAIYARNRTHSLERQVAQGNLAFLLLWGTEKQRAESVSLFFQALSDAERSKNVTEVGRMVAYLAVGYRRLRLISECRVLAHRCLELADESGHLGYVGVAEACLGWVDWHEERSEEALRRCQAAVAAWQRKRPADSTRRTEYPFQWLALLPLLALSTTRNRSTPAQIEAWVEDLLHPTQARLGHKLEGVLRKVNHIPGAIGERSWTEWFDEIVRIASRHGYL